jgi:hypothetical protein
MTPERLSPGEIPNDPQTTVRFYDADGTQHTIQRDGAHWVLTSFGRHRATTLATLEKTERGWHGVDADSFDQWDALTLAELVRQII